MAEPTVTVRKATAGNVPTPGTDLVTFFVDAADSLLKYKDELDVVRVAGPGLATSLVTSDTPNPAAVDGTVPVAGDVLIADNATQLSYGSPSLLPGVVVLDNNGATPRTAPFSAALGTMYVCSVAGGGFTVSLPPANAASVNREIWFKLVGSNGGNSLTLDPDAAETVDVSEPSLVLSLDRKWAKLRSDGNGNWLQIG